jgi:hypothetical protein
MILTVANNMVSFIEPRAKILILSFFTFLALC